MNVEYKAVVKVRRATSSQALGLRRLTLSEVMTYERQNLGVETLKVHVIWVDYIPIQTVLQGFCTTAGVNVMSWNKVSPQNASLSNSHHSGHTNVF